MLSNIFFIEESFIFTWISLCITLDCRSVFYNKCETHIPVFSIGVFKKTWNSFSVWLCSVTTSLFQHQTWVKEYLL